MIRPLQAINLVHAQMKAALESDAVRPGLDPGRAPSTRPSDAGERSAQGSERSTGGAWGLGGGAQGDGEGSATPRRTRCGRSTRSCRSHSSTAGNRRRTRGMADPALEPGQRAGAEAVVDAAAEADVLVGVGPGDVELSLAVGPNSAGSRLAAPEHQDHHGLAHLDRLAGDLGTAPGRCAARTAPGSRSGAAPRRRRHRASGSAPQHGRPGRGGGGGRAGRCR